MGTNKEYRWEFRLFYLWWSRSREPDLGAGPGAGPLHWLQLWPKSTGSGFGSATLDTIPIQIRYFLCRIRIGPFQYKSQNLAPFHPNLIKGDQRRSGCEHTEYWKKKNPASILFPYRADLCLSLASMCGLNLGGMLGSVLAAAEQKYRCSSRHCIFTLQYAGPVKDFTFSVLDNA